MKKIQACSKLDLLLKNILKEVEPYAMILVSLALKAQISQAQKLTSFYCCAQP